MLKLHASHASASEAGDYFQVIFQEHEDVEDGRYLLIQRQFELPDEECCAIETELPDMCGHFEIRRAVLKRSRFQVWWSGESETQADVTFEADDESYADISRIMRIMIPQVEVRPDDKMC
jgi:hypothetical protein